MTEEATSPTESTVETTKNAPAATPSGAMATLTTEVIKAAKDSPSMRQAGTEVGQTALTVTKAINNVLMPLAAVNFAFDKAKNYFQNSFDKELKQKASSIPERQLIEPTISIAGPAIQGLAFAHDEPNLKDMYLTLLSKAMNKETAISAHPSFVEIIKQLSPEEAQLIRLYIGRPINLPIVQLRSVKKDTQEYHTVRTHLVGYDVDGQPTENPRLPSMIDNWIRLGLITVDYTTFFNDDARYDWVKDRPEYIRAVAAITNPDWELSIEKGLFSPTEFGRAFVEAVGISGS